MANYVLAQQWARANTQDRLWYVETTLDFAEMMQQEFFSFGDKVYVMNDASFFIRGTDGWYNMEDGFYISDDYFTNIYNENNNIVPEGGDEI